MNPNIELGPGTLYIVGPDDSYAELGTVSEAKCTYEDYYEDLISNRVCVMATGLEGTFETLAKVSRDVMAAILGLTNAVLECCPNKRVVHLARYSKKHRTRKKNLHRAFRMMEKKNDIRK